MTAFTPSREFYIPKGAVKVADKRSDAVAYLYTGPSGHLCAMMFFGRRSKPEWRYRYANEASRTKAIKDGFTLRQSTTAFKAACAATAQAKGRGAEVGDILYASWGYDQTNVNFYQIVSLHGRTEATIREIGGEIEHSGDMSGRTTATKDRFIGEPKRVRLRDGRCKVGHTYASKWDGRPLYCSWYA